MGKVKEATDTHFSLETVAEPRKGLVSFWLREGSERRVLGLSGIHVAGRLKVCVLS